MKKIYLILLLGTLFFIGGCTSDDPDDPDDQDDIDVVEFTYEESGIVIGDDETLYYREYSVSTSCDQFDVFVLFFVGEYYYYLESYESMSGVCSSGLYVIREGEYIEVRNEYDFDGDIEDLYLAVITWGWEFTIYESETVPSEVTLAGLIADFETMLAEVQILTQKQSILADAISVENAAQLYCAQTTCTLTETLTWVQVRPYIMGIDESDYDFTNNGGIVATLSGGIWGIDLERAGTGEWEFTEGLNPSTSTVSDVIIDID